jgi:hypothetical protein
MRSALFALGFVLWAAHVLTAPATAAVSPYVRAGFAGSQLRMTDFNSATQDGSPFYAIAGLTSAFDDVGPAFGPATSAGLWLSPGIRLGATYSYGRTHLDHDLYAPGDVSFDDHMRFTIVEIGAEAALRFEKMAGLTLGASIASARARFERAFTGRDFVTPGALDLGIDARKRRWSYGVFVGLDQTDKAGIAGWVQAGFRLRDMGRMSQSGTSSDGSTTMAAGGITPWMDYSGLYLAAGTGFDWRH